MKKTLKFLGSTTLTIVILFAITTLLLSFTINPNKFKGKISQYVYAKTGQVLVINGDIHWSFFPWIGVKVQGINFYNSPNFTPKLFLSAKEMDIRVKLLPLLSRNVQIGTVTFDHLVVNVTKNKSGQMNWQTLTKMHQQASTNEEAATENENNSFQNMSITKMKVNHGTVNWLNQQNNQQITLNNFELNSKNINFSEPFPISLEFSVEDKDANKIADMALNTHAWIDTKHKKYQLSQLRIKGQLYNKQNKTDFRIRTSTDIDLAEDHLKADADFKIANLEGTILLKGETLTKTPYLMGTIKITPFNLKDFLGDLGHSYSTQNVKALSSVAAFTEFEMKKDHVKMNQLHINLDDAALSGNSDLQFNNRMLRFNLALDHLKADDYLSNKKQTTKNSDEEHEIAHKNSKSKPWTIYGTLRAEKLTYDKIQLSNVMASVKSVNDIVYVSPITANLYQGSMNAVVTIDKHNDQQTFFNIKPNLTNINIKQMLSELADSQKLSGTADISANLTTTTSSHQSFMQGLNGDLKVTLKNGALQGIDVIYQISRAHALIKRMSQPDLANTKETQFDQLTGTALIKNGKLDNNDLQLTSNYLNVSGKGAADLVSKDIKYYLKAFARPKLAENKDFEKEFVRYEIPIKVSGSLSKPSVNLDLIELTKMIYKQQIAKPITEQVKKPLKENINKNIENLKEKIKDKIKINIF